MPIIPLHFLDILQRNEITPIADQLSVSYNMMSEYGVDWSNDENSVDHSYTLGTDLAIDMTDGDTPVNDADPLNATKQTDSTPKMEMKILTASSNRLPHPCPVPSLFSTRVMHALSNNSLHGNSKLALIRETSQFYYGLCPRPTPVEYDIMAKTLSDKFPSLRNKIAVNGCDHVSF